MTSKPPELENPKNPVDHPLMPPPPLRPANIQGSARKRSIADTRVDGATEEKISKDYIDHREFNNIVRLKDYKIVFLSRYNIRTPKQSALDYVRDALIQMKRIDPYFISCKVDEDHQVYEVQTTIPKLDLRNIHEHSVFFNELDKVLKVVFLVQANLHLNQFRVKEFRVFQIARERSMTIRKTKFACLTKTIGWLEGLGPSNRPECIEQRISEMLTSELGVDT